MVIGSSIVAAQLPLWLAAAGGAGEKLPPPTKAAALMALLGIALLGMLLIVVILLGGNWVRRQGSYRRGTAVPPDRRPIVRDDSGRMMEGGPRSGDARTAARDTVDGDTGAMGETVVS